MHCHITYKVFLVQTPMQGHFYEKKRNCEYDIEKVNRQASGKDTFSNMRLYS